MIMGSEDVFEWCLINGISIGIEQLEFVEFYLQLLFQDSNTGIIVIFPSL